MNLSVYLMKSVEVVTLMVGWYYFRNLSKSYKLFVIYVSFSVLVGLLERYLIVILGSNHILYHFYSPIEFCFIIIGILLLINIDSLKTKALLIITPYLIFWIYAKLTLEPLNQMANVSIAVANTIVFIVAVFGSLRIALTSFGSIFRDPRITLIIGILIYFGGSIIIFALSNLIFHEGEIPAKSLWKIHNGMHILFNFIMIYSFYLVDLQSKLADDK